MITFQELILRLTHFWEKRGCIIHHGHDLETGAGTFNPATFLRCLGPEPYCTAYVEPSRRPSDARFGENPNRLQLFHQYQVIFKPSPPDIQKVYLESLKAIGFDVKKHDVRFVHDDWESPTLGAWGLGWEVWVDGMEVSQFTYFQAIASLPLKPVSAEITYGLERLCMFIQNVDNIFDIKWNDKLTLRDISHSSEVEWSMYNFNEASTQMWMRHFEDYEKEAKNLIGRNLPIPAYDFVVKASHAFNILDARGAISVTERTGYIGRIRELARLVAVEYLSSREKLEFPLLVTEKGKPVKPLPKGKPSFNPKKRADFLLEIGSEQLPATFVPVGCANLERTLSKFLKEHELPFHEIKVYGTPQRITALVKDLVEGTEEKTLEKKGPPASVAFDVKGQLTVQGKGFFKSIGLDETSLDTIRSGKVKGIELRAINGVDYLYASVIQKGKSTFALLQEHLPTLIGNLEFPKKMRWGNLDISYPRPVHWIVALHGTTVVPFRFGDVISGRTTHGHAQLSSSPISIKAPKDYLSQLKKHKVLADIQERKLSILKQLRALEKQIGGKIVEEEKVLSQVLFLAEWPRLAAATFNRDFLEAPSEVLISEMVEHQKYFPVVDKNGKLKNTFIITADNTPNNLIRHGNQKVLSARLSDGVFLYHQDLKTPLEKFNEKLKVMTFQKELGSMLDKVLRIASIAQTLNRELSIADQKKVERAALLCKADLASALVGEFPELQGTIGKYYALVQHENVEVATAIEEHWFPKSEQGDLPKTPTGIILSLADKIDNLLAYFSVGLKPTSSSDPFALRRQTFGFLKILIEERKSVDLRALLLTCAALFPKIKGHESKIVDEILVFITQRAKSLFEDYGFKKDEIEASLQGSCLDPFDQFCKVKALHEFRRRGSEFARLFEVYKRAKGQLEKPSTTLFNPGLALEPAEKDLVKQLEMLHKNWGNALTEKDYVKACTLISGLQPYLAKLFDTVKILADDPKLQQNRIALLQKVFSYFEDLLDFSKIQEG